MITRSDSDDLTSITFLGAAPSLGTGVFTGNPGGLAYYNPSTSGWGSVTPAEIAPFNFPATDTVSFNSEGGSAVTSISGLDGTTSSLPSAPTYPGYTFDGWFSAASGGSALTSPYTFAGSTTLDAQWTANATDTVSFNSEGGSAVTSISGLDGTTSSLPSAPTYPGYTFDGWFSAASGGMRSPLPTRSPARPPSTPSGPRTPPTR